MRDRANNNAERRFKVGDRVLIKNTKRDRQSEQRYDTPGRIIIVKEGSFTIQLDDGGFFIF